MQKTKKNSSEFSGLIFRISDHQKTANSSESSIAPGPVIQAWTIKGCMESGSAISWRLGPRTLPKKHPSKIERPARIAQAVFADRQSDPRGSVVRDPRAEVECADPSSVRVTVGNDGSAPARYSDEVFVHARMLSGHHRRGLTPADDDGSHSRIQ